MEEKDFICECLRLFELNGLKCHEEQAKKLYLLTNYMLKVNTVMNLTAIKEEKAVILKHYVDSLTVSAHIPTGSKIIDVGCGAGFPTLPLAIFRPDIKILALDGTAKRIKYVEEAAEMLGLDNITAISGRAEELSHRCEYRERFDIATARAVAALPVLSEFCLPFVRVGGKMIAMKALQGEEELSASHRAIELCGGKTVDTTLIEISNGLDEADKRCIITIEKVSLTPKIYPRHFSKISKKHL